MQHGRRAGWAAIRALVGTHIRRSYRLFRRPLTGFVLLGPVIFSPILRLWDLNLTKLVVLLNALA